MPRHDMSIGHMYTIQYLIRYVSDTLICTYTVDMCIYLYKIVIDIIICFEEQEAIIGEKKCEIT